MITNLKLSTELTILLFSSHLILGDQDRSNYLAFLNSSQEQRAETMLPITANVVPTIPAIDQELVNDQHLWEAVRFGNYSRTRELVEGGANVHSTLLHTISGRRHNLLDEALQHTPFLQFASPFFRFCSNDRAKIFYLLRSRGAYPESLSNRILFAVKDHPDLSTFLTVSTCLAITLKILGT